MIRLPKRDALLFANSCAEDSLGKRIWYEEKVKHYSELYVSRNKEMAEQELSFNNESKST